MANGKVYLVGAGPGDKELITLKGLRLISSADVILYDHLISMDLLDLAKPNTEIISVGKFAGKHTVPQDSINDLLVEKAKQGKTVVRLKGGDCYLFGRGGEEVEACFDNGIEFEVVPGVTSALAAPCYAGIPPTHRDCTSNLAIVTGHRKKGDDRPIDIPKAGTIVFLMSVSNIKNIVDSLLTEGFPKETKIAAIEHGTWYDQRVITGTLENFIEKLEQAGPRTPAIFIVGKVVEMQRKLDWFTKKPNVLILGNHPEKYNQLGNIVHRRIIDCVPADDYTRADAMLQKIDHFDWIVFTSVNGAKYMFQRLNKMGADARSLAKAKIAAIGKTTAARLTEYGILPDMVPDNESSQGLLEEFKKLDITGKNILLPAAEISSKELTDGLEKAGAIVEKVTVYKTVEIEPAEVDLKFIDQVLFTSGSTVKAFANKFGQMPPHIKVYALGKPTQKTAADHGIKADIVPYIAEKLK